MTGIQVFFAIIGGVAGYILAATIHNLITHLILIKKIKVHFKSPDSVIVPSNTRIVTSSGEQFFTTEKATIRGGYLIVQVSKDSL